MVRIVLCHTRTQQSTLQNFPTPIECQRDGLFYLATVEETNKQTDRQIDRHTGKETDQETDIDGDGGTR